MRALLLFFMTVYFVVAVGLRRLWRGSLRPGWPWLFEALVELLRWATARMARRGLIGLDSEVAPPAWPVRRACRDLRFVPRRLAGMRAESIESARGGAERTILYCHGGGYVTCSVDSHRDLMARLAREAGARVIGFDYRLAPAHAFPAPVDDACAAYGALLAEGVDPSTLLVAGDSAGGGLALALLLVLRDAGRPLPAGALLFSPWVDLTDRTGSMVENCDVDYLGSHPEGQLQMVQAYLQGADPADPRASPARGELSGLPPLLLQVGGSELLRDQVLALAERARQAGVVVDVQAWPDMVHVFQAFASVSPAGREALAMAGAWARVRVPGRGAAAPESRVVAA